MLFLLFLSAASSSCNDDPSFNIGYGGCSTYAPGGRNAPYCALDGATTRCLCSCGQPSNGGQSGQCQVANPTCGAGMYCQADGTGGTGTCQPTPSCGVYETLSNCGAACDPKCGVAVVCGNSCNPPQPACICASGFARSNGQCIPQDQCPQAPVASCSSHAACGAQSYCMSCTKCILTVGFLYAKTLCAACNVGSSMQKLSSCEPIAGCASRQDGIDGKCPVTVPGCGANEVHLTCSSLCEPKCGEANIMCASVCGPPKCQCAGGFVRNANSQCVVPSQCPTPTSPPTTAVSPTPAPGVSQCSSHAMCGPQQYCMSCSKCMLVIGYVHALTFCGACNIGTSSQKLSSCGPLATCATRHDGIDGNCPSPTTAPPPIALPPTATTSNCGPNEVYKSCSSLCEPQCGQTDVLCTTACGPPKCQCVSGMVRSGSQCVSPSTCQQQGAQVPVATICGPDTCVLQCPQGRVKGPDGCPLCQCQVMITCSSSPCPVGEQCVALSFTCTTWPCQKYTCVGKSGGKPPGAPCVSSTECQSFNICYKNPNAPTALCVPGSG